MKQLAFALLLCISSCKLMCMESLAKKDTTTTQDIITCLKACRLGDLSTVQTMHQKGVQLDKPLGPPFVEYGYEGSSFLLWSVRHPDLVTFLLKYAPAHAPDDEQHTPLAEAICHVQPRTVVLLLEHGAKPAYTDLSLNSSLHEVARSAGQGFLGVDLPPQEKMRRACGIIHLLKTKNAPLFLQNRALDTPFHLAAPSKDHDIMVSLLLPAESAQLKADARARFFTFLCVNKRLANVQDKMLELPKELVHGIFSYMPIECTYARIDGIRADVSNFIEELYSLSFEDKIVLINRVLVDVDRNMLLQTLQTPNVRGLTPMQLATDQNVKKLFDPETWKK